LVLNIVQVADCNIDGCSQINCQQFGAPVAQPDNFSTQGYLPESYLKNGSARLINRYGPATPIEFKVDQ